MLIASSLALVMSLAPPAHAFSFGKKSTPPAPPPVAEAPEEKAPEEKAPSGISSSAKSYQLSGDVGLEYEAATNQTYNVRDKYAKKAPKQYKKFEQDPATSYMTQERIERLEGIAFQWNGRSLKRNRRSSEECDDDGDDDEEEQCEEDEEEEEIEESKASSESTKSRLNAELTHKKRVIYKEQGQEAKKQMMEVCGFLQEICMVPVF